MRFEYQTRHIPTGTVIKTPAEFENEVDFLRFLNKWNVEGMGWYIYTAVDQSSLRPKAGCAHNFNDAVTIQETQRDMNDITIRGGYWQSMTGLAPKQKLELIRIS